MIRQNNTETSSETTENNLKGSIDIPIKRPNL